MLVVTLSPESLMDIFKAGQTFQNADGTRLYTVTKGIPLLPLADMGISAGGMYELALDDGEPDVVRHQSVEVHCTQGQGLPHDFDAYAHQAYLAYHGDGALGADPLFPWHKLRPIVQAAWRSVAVRIARLTTHTLAEQAGDKERA